MALEDFWLDGKVALVTGAAQGLGEALAVGLAEAGADIIALDRLSVERCLAQVAALGRRGVGITAELAQLTPERARALIAASVAEWGRLDILVNNAGMIRREPALTFSSESWEAVLDLDLSAVFYLSQAVAQHFTQADQSGKIINVASMLSFQGGVQVASYAAAKSGVAGLTRALANEWAPLGINVNALAPGYMVTDVTAGLRDDPVRSQAILERIPAGRWGQPGDLKGAVVFLASEAARYIHGVILPVDGGWLAR